MPEDYKSLEGKQVTVFWSDNREEIKTVDKVNGKFVLFSGEKDWVSMHRIDGMEVVEDKEDAIVNLHSGGIITLKDARNEVATFSSEYFNSIKNECQAKPKRLSRPYKKPKAYQRYSEGGIWYVHHGNGAGINVKGRGGTLEAAYFDWKGKHAEKQGQRK